MFLVAIAQTILHYLGWIGIILGVLALIVGNTHRGTELIIGGIGYLILKYVIGFLYALLSFLKSKFSINKHKLP